MTGVLATSILQTMFAVGQTAWQREVLATVVRVTDWLREPVAVGQTWEHPFQTDGLKGRQCYRVEGSEAVGSDTLVSLKVVTEVGAFGGHSLPSGAQLVSAESAVVWSADDRELVSLDGQVTCRHGGRAGGRETAIRVKFARVNHRRLSDEQQDSERRALIQVTEAVAAYQRDDRETALKQAQRFSNLYRSSLWRPAAEDLERRIEAQRALAKPLPTEQLQQTLTGLLAQWGEAEADADEDVTGRLRKTLTLLTQVNRPELIRLLEETDGVYRALAYFALAFGTAPADAAVMQHGLEDGEARVRRLALYALSVRALPITEVDRLLTLLRDDDTTVRSQACEALGACRAADPAEGVKLVAALVERLSDDSPGVVVAAAKALVRIGSPADLAQVQQAVEHTAPGPLRDALQEILKNAQTPAPAKR